MQSHISEIEVYTDSRGTERFRRIDKLVIPDRAKTPQRSYALRRLSRAQLRATIDAEVAAGAIFSPAPSLDQRRLLEL